MTDQNSFSHGSLLSLCSRQIVSNKIRVSNCNTYRTMRIVIHIVSAPMYSNNILWGQYGSFPALLSCHNNFALQRVSYWDSIVVLSGEAESGCNACRRKQRGERREREVSTVVPKLVVGAPCCVPLEICTNVLMNISTWHIFPVGQH
jgi:hypothetical protein